MPASDQLEAPPPTQTPSRAKQPSERSSPPAKVEVAFSVTLREPAKVEVPLPVV